MDFQPFQKIARLSREVVVTEKIDGTNAQIYIETLGVGLHEPQVQNWPFVYAKETSGGTIFIYAGSRTKWITPGKNDNAGFAGWVKEHAEELLELGEGRHFGEWWGKGIQRGYGLQEKRFSLFNTSMWHSQWNSQDFTKYSEENKNLYSTKCTEIPSCYVVPVLGTFIFREEAVQEIMESLSFGGSFAAPGFMKPEGIVLYHTAGGYYFKKTIENDASPKSLIK